MSPSFLLTPTTRQAYHLLCSCIRLREIPDSLGWLAIVGGLAWHIALLGWPAVAGAFARFAIALMGLF